MKFYNKMIKTEDHHSIAWEIRERSSYYGMYNIYTKNKLLKCRIQTLRDEVKEEQA